MTDVDKTRNVEQALNAIYRALLELCDAGETLEDETLDEAFELVVRSKVKLERWIRENNDD